MTTDEALLHADAIDAPVNGKGASMALVVLAAEVRRQHAAIEEAKRSLELVIQILEVAGG